MKQGFAPEDSEPHPLVQVQPQSVRELKLRALWRPDRPHRARAPKRRGQPQAQRTQALVLPVLERKPRGLQAAMLVLGSRQNLASQGLAVGRSQTQALVPSLLGELEAEARRTAPAGGQEEVDQREHRGTRPQLGRLGPGFGLPVRQRALRSLCLGSAVCRRTAPPSRRAPGRLQIELRA